MPLHFHFPRLPFLWPFPLVYAIFLPCWEFYFLSLIILNLFLFLSMLLTNKDLISS